MDILSMKALKCQNCGANLELYLNNKRATCPFCGSNYILENVGIDVINEFNNTDRFATIKTVFIEPYDRIDLFGKHFGEWETVEPERMLNTILERLCSVSACAYVFKKNYNINSIDITENINFVLPAYTPFLTIDNSVIPAERKDYYNLPDEIRRVVPLGDSFVFNNLNSNKDVKNNFIQQLEKHGLIVSETIEEKTVSSSPDWAGNPFKKRYIGTKYEKHQLKIEFPIITPHFLEKYFCDVFDRYATIKKADAIEKIAGDIISVNEKPNPPAMLGRME